MFLKLSQNFMWPKKFSHWVDNHYKTIYVPVRSECSSCRVLKKLYGEKRKATVSADLNVNKIKRLTDEHLSTCFCLQTEYDLQEVERRKMISVPPQGAGGGGGANNHHAGLTIGKYG